VKTCLLVLMLLFAVDCRKEPAASPGKESSNPYDGLWQPDSKATEQLGKLEKRLKTLEIRVNDLEPSEATVNTEDASYDIARTRFGPFTVVCMGVTPYLDGFKIKLAIGNLTTATFHGAKLRLTWGPPFDEKAPQNFLESRKHRDIDLTANLNPGSYRIAEVIATPAKPEEIRSIGVGIELKTISLKPAP
jgi:hypothetical protein